MAEVLASSEQCRVTFHETFSEGIERNGGKEKEKERGEKYDGFVS
jgi:hypothetical protein